MATGAKAGRCRAGIASAALLAALLLVLQQLSAAGPDSRSQAEIVEQVLSGLKPASPSDPKGHLYFVSFAGYGPEAVFKREAVAVRDLFDERFGTRQRSVALVNHVSTVDQFPLASAQNLDRVLRHLGHIMNPQRDTLFLFLTSHGEPSLLAVEMPGVRLAHLTPAMLRNMLDRSGIRHRIVVVSACHAGSFIPRLANPNTLVIAAARADRTSFGCADKREWTYFGDAYFNTALRQERSFRRAFDRARELVKRWEADERLLPSLPQIRGGEALKLDE